MEKKIKVCFINSVCGFGSTGRIVEDLANMEGIESLIIYGRKNSNNPKAYKMTSLFGNCVAALNTILFNKNGLSNIKETKKAIEKIKAFNPDIIHLHNLHGYYINYEILFKFLKEYNKPVIWTLHDCWAFTGYCPCFDYVECDGYKKGCSNCPKTFSYPFSLFKQKTHEQYENKKQLINDIGKITLALPSKWLEDRVNESYLNKINNKVIYNGIDLCKFKPSSSKNDKFTILFVANVWTKEKGIDEIENLLPLIDKDIEVIVVGNVKVSNKMKERCKIIQQTENINELTRIYSKAHLFINPTLEEAFGLVNAESLACGTPVITYSTGGASEIPDKKCGIIIEKRNIGELAKTINSLKTNYSFATKDCIERSKMFSSENMLNKYVELYEEVFNV